MKWYRVTRYSGEYLRKLANDIRDHPAMYVGWTVKTTMGGITIIIPGGRALVDRETFPRGMRDLGWLSRARKALAPLLDATADDLRGIVDFPVGEMPHDEIRVPDLRALDGRRVVYIDLAAAYWAAIQRVWHELYSTTDFPVNASGVPKQVRNAVWGGWGVRARVECVEPPGRIVVARKSKPRPPIFYAVPWVIARAMAKATAGERCVVWVDSVVAVEDAGNRILARLSSDGWRCHVVRGKAIVDGELDIVDPETGEVLKAQRWPILSQDYQKFHEREVVIDSCGE